MSNDLSEDGERNCEKIVQLFGPTNEPLPIKGEPEELAAEPAEVKPELGVFIDPGSRETGWCVAIPLPDFGVKILGAGTLGFNLRHEKHPYLRIDDIRRGLERLMDSLDPVPSLFAIEVTSGKVNRGRHKGGGAGLATFGVAVGALWTFGLMWKPKTGNGPVVIPVRENFWKSGFGKLKSMRVARRHFEKYDEKNDPEFNIADAIAFAVWYYTACLRKLAEDKAKREAGE